MNTRTANRVTKKRGAHRSTSTYAVVMLEQDSDDGDDQSSLPIGKEIDILNKEDLEGDGGGSDMEGEEAEDVLVHMTEDMAISKDCEVEQTTQVGTEGETKAMLKITGTGGMEVIGSLPLDGSKGDKFSNIKLPRPDPEWEPPAVKEEKGEPHFHNVDNPGQWDRYYFQPKFVRGGTKEYICHQLPTGAVPVPKGKDGKRTVGDWEFHYNGFKNEDMPYRHGATTSNLFPKEMEGHLDADILKKLGLTKERVTKVDALFFFQLILPFCDPSKSGIEDDPRYPYYTEVEKFTNTSKSFSGAGISYGHEWNPATANELLCHDGILFLDGALGGSNGALYRRWDPSSIMFSKQIADAMTLTRYGELKRNKKLCVNEFHHDRQHPKYNPAYKYDLVYKAIVTNTNAISAKADESQVIDETTWGHSGYGESGSGITGRLQNKKVSKGGQTVLMMDRNRFRIRAYLHRNRIYDKLYPEERSEWKKKGPFELVHLSKRLLEMVDGEPGGAKKLFRKKPVICGDNYFQEDKIMDWMGEKGLGGIFTAARDRLPSDIPSEYLHKNKTDPHNKAAKVARFAQPIIAVKNDGNKNFQRIHISFQSTSSCNISTVNALNEVFNFAELRERGRGEKKRYWVIEMNHGRRIYLSLYNGIDVLDHLLKNARLFYISWKYWHAPMNHALAIAIAVAYDIYIEVTLGNLDPEWKADPVSSWEFHKTLALQAISYSPLNNEYPGDDKLRVVTKLPRRKRRKAGDSGDKVSSVQLRKEILPTRSRGCGDLDKLCRHMNSIEKISGGRVCSWCGVRTYHVCTLCKGADGKGVPLHFKKKGAQEPTMCFWDYHNDSCIGLGKEDQVRLLKKLKKDWEEPTERERKSNKKHIEELKKQHDID